MCGRARLIVISGTGGPSERVPAANQVAKLPATPIQSKTRTFAPCVATQRCFDLRQGVGRPRVRRGKEGT
jgi:hypothetical protein